MRGGVPPAFERAPLEAFFMGGFEGASQRRSDGVRLDLLRATRHDRYARQDYAACRAAGLSAVRDALRWHLIETSPGRYDWSSWQQMLDAAAAADMPVLWTLYHYGSPDHLDQRADDFPARFAAFAGRAAEIHSETLGFPPAFCPINEISFFAWAVGKRYFPLAGPIRGSAFKRQLIRCAVAAGAAIRSAAPAARLLWAEPLVHVAPRSAARDERHRAEARRLTQFEALDLLTGAAEPELGGHPALVDLIGLNFYPHNQWYLHGATVPLGHHEYRPLAAMLAEVAARYGKPLLIAETGAEGSARPAWLHYVCAEAMTAMNAGVDLRGICLAPVTHYPGWDNGRLARTGLFSEADDMGERTVEPALLAELHRQALLFAAFATEPPAPGDSH